MQSCCAHTHGPGCGRVWWRALTGSWFLPTGAWVQVSPSPELREGQAVVLSCQVPTGVLEGTSYLWYRDGQPLPESNLATLRFAAITVSQAGAYHCQARSPSSATTSLAAPVILHVSCKLSSRPCFLGGWRKRGHSWGRGRGKLRHPDHRPPPVDAPREAVLTALMDTGPRRLGLLLCRVNSDPPAQLQLLHGDHLVASTLQGVGELASSSSRLQVAVAPNTLRLEIHGAALEDEGVYTCRATNALGQASASANFDAQGQCGDECGCMDVSFMRGGEAGEGSRSQRHRQLG